MDGRSYQNNSIVRSSTLREGSGTLICETPLETCCSTEETGSAPLGSWIMPDGSTEDGENLNIRRGPSKIYLKIRRDTLLLSFPLSGMFTCIIPDSNNVVRSLYILMYSSFRRPGENTGGKVIQILLFIFTMVTMPKGSRFRFSRQKMIVSQVRV